MAGLPFATAAIIYYRHSTRQSIISIINPIANQEGAIYEFTDPISKAAERRRFALSHAGTRESR